MENIQSKVGRRIREFRHAKGYSIEELAHLANLNAVHLSALERGEKNATLTTLERACAALAVSFDALFDFSDETVSPSPDPLHEKTIAVLHTLSKQERQFIYDTALFLSRNKKVSKRVSK